MVTTEDFIQHSVNKAEIHALEWAIKLFDKHPKELVIEQLQKYIQELKDDEACYDSN